MSVYIVTHKYLETIPELDGYQPLYVGAYRQPDRRAGYCFDDVGKQISEKNGSFCELTGLYWIWQNCHDEVKGLVHYRRYFTHNPWSEKASRFYTMREYEKKLRKYDCLVSERVYCPYGSVRAQYERHHNPEDIRLAEEMIRQYEPDYWEAFQTAMAKDYLIPFNMIIARRALFDEYAEWLMNLLFHIEEHRTACDEDAYQSRVYGFLAERLFHVWLIHNHVKFKELPTVQFGTRFRYRLRTQLELVMHTSLHFLALWDKKLGERHG